MKPAEISHHIETSLEIAQGIIDLYSGPSDFHDNWAEYLSRLGDRVSEELLKNNELVERARQQEARHEPEYAH
ncbi:hypothetical protein [Hymenobacter siberiensis]|uniref:hypothetical protein n=1 Tax=Hymenobacter siberiensis TaxID=2848396 RepID=UPI001C1DE02B|nr:hypothetical protein [Hymenobacter siberiensis]